MGKAKSALRSQERAFERIKRVIEKALRVCEGRGLELEGVYLVGSRARGDYLEDSDADLVLIVRGVEGLNALQRMELFKDSLEPNVELLIYTPEEWRSSDSAWITELRREAKKICGKYDSRKCLKSMEQL